MMLENMKSKLSFLYSEKERIEKEILLLRDDYAQVIEDIEMAQTIIMYSMNKKARE